MKKVSASRSGNILSSIWYAQNYRWGFILWKVQSLNVYMISNRLFIEFIVIQMQLTEWTVTCFTLLSRGCYGADWKTERFREKDSLGFWASTRAWRVGGEKGKTSEACTNASDKYIPGIWGIVNDMRLNNTHRCIEFIKLQYFIIILYNIEFNCLKSFLYILFSRVVRILPPNIWTKPLSKLRFTLT